MAPRRVKDSKASALDFFSFPSMARMSTRIHRDPDEHTCAVRAQVRGAQELQDWERGDEWQPRRRGQCSRTRWPFQALLFAPARPHWPYETWLEFAARQHLCGNGMQEDEPSFSRGSCSQLCGRREMSSGVPRGTWFPVAPWAHSWESPWFFRVATVSQEPLLQSLGLRPVPFGVSFLGLPSSSSSCVCVSPHPLTRPFAPGARAGAGVPRLRLSQVGAPSEREDDRGRAGPLRHPLCRNHTLTMHGEEPPLGKRHLILGLVTHLQRVK